MLLAENYFALKLAEAWKEIVTEFERVSFTPDPFDKYILDNFVDKMNLWTGELKQSQLNIIKAGNEMVLPLANNTRHSLPTLHI